MITINTIEINKEYIQEFSDFIKLSTDPKDVTIHVPEHQKIYNRKLRSALSFRNERYKIACIYIRSRGFITKHHDPYHSDPDIAKNNRLLLVAYTRYPHMFELTDDLTSDQLYYLINNHMKLLTKDFIESILTGDYIKRIEEKYNIVPIFYNHNHNNHSTVNEDNNNNKPTINIAKQSAYLIPLLNRITYIPDISESTNEPKWILLNSKRVDLNSKYIDEDGTHIFKYNEFSPKYHDGMLVVESSEDLEDVIHMTYENIYINGDIRISLKKILKHNKIYRDGKLQTLNNIKPECFKTWMIGPNCRRLDHLFKKYPFQPCVEHWEMNMKTCIKLFAKSGVVDLSGWTIDRCCNADSMFLFCDKLIKLPKFDVLLECRQMCLGCTRLESIDDAIISPYMLNSIESAFNGCETLRECFNNTRLTFERTCGAFRGCTNLESVFNNCEFTGGGIFGTTLAELFYKCQSLKRVLNNCTFEFRRLEISDICVECPNLVQILSNCKFVGYPDEISILGYEHEPATLILSKLVKDNHKLKVGFYGCLFEAKMTSNGFSDRDMLDIEFGDLYPGCKNIKKMFVKCKCKHVNFGEPLQFRTNSDKYGHKFDLMLSCKRNK